MKARMALLDRLFDDAGLFPPARKPLPAAVADHAATRRGPAAWMLRRFLCPAFRLEELAAADGPAGWELGIILSAGSSGGESAGASASDDWRATVEAELQLVAAHARGAARAIEVALPAGATGDGGGAAALVRAALEAARGAGLPGPLEVVFEVPVGTAAGEDGEALAATLKALAAARADTGEAAVEVAVKVRCGGPDRDSFPPAAALAAFVSGCHRLGVPFKATAGLHHPFRLTDAATGALQHGFVNLLAAAALAAELEPAQLEALIAERDPDAFSVDGTAIRWRRHRAGPEGVARGRRLLTAIGSCSIEEPVADLAAAGILPAEAATTIGAAGDG